MADDNEPFPRWAIRYVIVPLVVALITAGVIFARRDGGDEKVNTATQVRACMTHHKMDQAETQTTLAPTTGEYEFYQFVTYHKKCEWPPGPGAQPDGYSEIRVTATEGPGPDEASGTNLADIIKSKCTQLEVVYSIAAQGYQEPLPPFRSEPNRVVRDNGEAWHRESYEDPLPFYHRRDELVVLRNGKVRLDEVRCMK